MTNCTVCGASQPHVYDCANDERDVEIVSYLRGLPGWVDFSGDCSTQAALCLPDGRYLRVGVTDSDVAATPGLWADIYGGVKLA